MHQIRTNLDDGGAAVDGCGDKPDELVKGEDLGADGVYDQITVLLSQVYSHLGQVLDEDGLDSIVAPSRQGKYG